MSLSEKRFESPGIEFSEFAYLEEDVREKVMSVEKRLKEAIKNGHNYETLGAAIFFKESIVDEIWEEEFGEKLNG